MSQSNFAPITVRLATPDDLRSARALMWRVVDNDYGYGRNPMWHRDIDDLQGCYLETPGHALFLAVTPDGTPVGTAGVRRPQLTSPPHPQAVVERYDPARTIELVRVFAAPGWRRLGIARALVEAARDWVRASGAYTAITLHTEFADPFWRALRAVEVHDARRPDGSGSVYFELPL